MKAILCQVSSINSRKLHRTFHLGLLAFCMLNETSSSVFTLSSPLINYDFYEKEINRDTQTFIFSQNTHVDMLIKKINCNKNKEFLN